MRILRVAILFCIVPVTPEAIAADIFVYVRVDGSKLITDHARLEPGYTLIKIYKSDDTDDTRVLATPRRLPVKTRTTDFDGLIQNVSDSITLDPALIKSVMHAESAFDPGAISRKGASGLMQLMPATAQRYGVTRIFDPQQNILAGSRYLRDLLTQFDGDMRLALAGYNAGENAVVKYGGIPPYSETRNYVRKVLELYKSYRNLHCSSAPSGVRVISCTGSGAAKQSASWTMVQ